MATPGVNPLTGAPVTPSVNTQVTGTAVASTIQGVDMQSLVVAFSLGILANAASATAFIMVKGKTTSIWKDGQRLVLAIFLISVALWANIDFISTLISQTSNSGCQVAVAFSSTFDQVARVALLQYFLWASAGSAQTALQRFLPQGLLLARFILGGVFVGMQRPQFNPICVPTTQVMPVSIATIVTDGAVFLVCMLRVFSAGRLRDAKEGTAGHQKAKGVRFTLAGFVLWMGTSIPMHLGTTTLPVALRVALPAATATILVAVISAFCRTLPLSDARPSSFTPEAPSPRPLSTTRDLQSRDFQSRDLSSSDSDYPPSRYEDLKRDEIISITAFPKPPTRDGPREQSPIEGTLPAILNAMPGQAVTGVGGLPVQGQLFPPTRAETAPAVRDLKPSEGRADSVRPKKGFFSKSAAGGAAATRLAISGPVLQSGDGALNPLDKIPTVDLATAARNERDRREQANQSPDSTTTTLVAIGPVPQPPVITQEEAARRAQSVRRKDIASTTTPPESNPEPQVIGQETRGESVAITTSAELSPGADELRRRSPRALESSRPAPQLDQAKATLWLGIDRPGSYSSPNGVSTPDSLASAIVLSAQGSVAITNIFTSANHKPKHPTPEGV
ncbi:uncharacterized protein DNG_07742 [Cephalotrichum gorgonifer]|uniref:Transmembrane protein n=1 Tax=Cephalotrichum gorgonifer TaxID=2041049 RepID=A0AAE8SYI2_9PEZI|nr:uncharacterized protein DNG_07742 [Cephalotrichum gorgonifer]